MAEERGKDLFTRLAEAGEDAIQRISDMPGAAKLTDTVNTLRGRVDELQRPKATPGETATTAGETATATGNVGSTPTAGATTPGAERTASALEDSQNT